MVTNSFLRCLNQFILLPAIYIMEVLDFFLASLLSM